MTIECVHSILKDYTPLVNIIFSILTHNRIYIRYCNYNDEFDFNHNAFISVSKITMVTSQVYKVIFFFMDTNVLSVNLIITSKA